MKELADLIVLEVGFQQYLRMNAARVQRSIGRKLTRIDFLLDTRQRSANSRSDGWSKLSVVLAFLRQQLTPGRLTLPDGYDLSERRK